MTNVVEKLPNIEADLRAQLYYYQITGIKVITLEPIIRTISFRIAMSLKLHLRNFTGPSLSPNPELKTT